MGVEQSSEGYIGGMRAVLYKLLESINGAGTVRAPNDGIGGNCDLGKRTGNLIPSCCPGIVTKDLVGGIDSPNGAIKSDGDTGQGAGHGVPSCTLRIVLVDLPLRSESPDIFLRADCNL